MFKKIDYVMINVSDMSRSVQFYRDTLGLPLKMESPGWSEFATGETTFALHGGGQPGQLPQGPVAGVCSIGFNVEDVDAIHSQLQAKGVRFVMPPTTREQEGIRLAVCLDPDGSAISFASPLKVAH
jgi:lactoylglutathione lyase